MFIFTTKFNKKKAVIAVLILAAILIAIVLIAGSVSSNNARETAALSAVVKTNTQRVKYLNSLGWEVDKKAVEEQKVVIPRDFSDVYKRYNEIQLAQGFDLSKYAGIEATRYTYKVLNYPNAKGNVVADMLVYRNEVIAGDVQSNALDGFMIGLKYPKEAAIPSPSASCAEPTASLAPESSAPVSPSPDNSAENNNAESNNAATNIAASDAMATETDVSAEDAP